MKNKKIVFISIGILLIALSFIIPIVISKVQTLEQEGKTITPTQFASMNLSEYDLNQTLINVYEDNYYYYFDISYTPIRPVENFSEIVGYGYYTHIESFIKPKEIVRNAQELEQVIQGLMIDLRDYYVHELTMMQPREKTQVTYFNDKIGKKWDHKTNNFVGVVK